MLAIQHVETVNGSTFLYHIPKLHGYQERCHLGFLEFSVFITSITLFPQLYNVVLIFLHRREWEIAVEKFDWALREKKTNKPTKHAKWKPDNCIEHALFQQLQSGIIAIGWVVLSQWLRMRRAIPGHRVKCLGWTRVNVTSAHWDTKRQRADNI